jgi:uncharacterized membrane protein
VRKCQAGRSAGSKKIFRESVVRKYVVHDCNFRFASLMFETPIVDVAECIVTMTWTRIALKELVAIDIFACLLGEAISSSLLW